ncbi:MAG: cytochrome c biogenesis protein CcsA [Bacteroidales bacterium]|nr:cytochrome c biogenesis protein CcsA [Bacteroidales bacterium]
MIWKILNVVFILFATLWAAGSISLFKKNETKISKYLTIIFPGIANILLAVFIAFLWTKLERPPLKTMAETRLWYAMFVSLITWIIYLKTKSKPLYLLGFIMSSVFLLIDILKPEYQTKNLMPALQSPWFIPHVVIYMISYAVLAAACLTVLIGVYNTRKNKTIDTQNIILSMNLVYPGFGLLSLGMIMGAVWAKIAWGDYWSWDPKETWALLTWLFYLICIHLHHAFPKKQKLLMILLAFSFIVLIITWLGIRYFPNGLSSIHVYG